MLDLTVGDPGHCEEMNLKTLLSATLNLARAPFLLLTVIVVGLGASIAYYEVRSISIFLLGVVLTGALAAHIAVNALNEYLDFSSGLDEKTQRTPFSGGSGFLPDHPGLAPYAKWLGMAALIVTIGTGFYLVGIRGWGLLPFGVVGIVLIVSYTPWINQHPYLCLIAPGFGFGPLMMLGTYYVLAGNLTTTAAIASLVVALLVNNLLLLNQFPDVDADKTVGRRHFPIVIGRYRSAWIYAGTTAIAFGMVIVFAIAGVFPKNVLWALLIVPLAAAITVRTLRHADNLPELIKVLGLNVALTLGAPALLALGFVAGEP